MIILKAFPHEVTADEFRDNIVSRTSSYTACSHHSSGVYSRLTKRTVTLIDVDSNTSLRGETFNICLYSIIISIFSKKYLLGWSGPSLIYTALTLLIVLCPIEYLEFRFIAFFVWLIVYLSSVRRMSRLKNVLLCALDG